MIKNMSVKMYLKNKSFFLIKRLFDIFSSFFAIILLSPLLIIVSIIQVFTLKSFKIFFLDKRVGLNNKDVCIYKFRSMYIDAESNIDKYFSPQQLAEWKKERKVNNDPRITPFGRIIRKTSIDELPQLFNIFLGHMSVVGPRPITRKELETNFSHEEQRLLLSCRPGLIGIWGVTGRNNINYENGERQRVELSYFKKLSIFQDIHIILLAIPAVLGEKGAK